jgi:hypothetical protein
MVFQLEIQNILLPIGIKDLLTLNPKIKMKLYLLYFFLGICDFFLIAFTLGFSMGFSNYFPVITFLSAIILFSICLPLIIFLQKKNVFILSILFCILLLPYNILIFSEVAQNLKFNISLIILLLPFMNIWAIYEVFIRYKNENYLLLSNTNLKFVLGFLPILLTLLYIILFGQYWSLDMFKF